MATKVYDDIRRFKEFYGDKMQRQVLYLFCHRFLPQYVQGNPLEFFRPLYTFGRGLGIVDPVFYIQSRWQLMEDTYGWSKPEQHTGIFVFRRIKELYMWVQEIEDYPTVFIELPVLGDAGEICSMAAVLLAQGTCPDKWPSGTQVRMFALQHSIEGDKAKTRQALFLNWPLIPGGHKQGLLVDASLESFSVCVKEQLIKC
ncbi:hypothetical protein ACFL6U_29110 [Planctomycetota bacterium]